MHALRISLAALLIAFFMPFVAVAEDAEGGMDHPRIPRLTGYSIQSHEGSDFGAHEFYTAEDKPVKVEGRYWRIDYRITEGAKVSGPLEIARNYGNAFKAKGGGVYEADVSNSGGTTYAWMQEADKETWLEIDTADAGESYSLIIVEKAALKQQVEIGAEQIAKELAEKGTIALYGINFDTDKSEIRPDSQKTLQVIADALKSAPQMKVEIGGHTDNVGGKDYNQKLSEARAASVQKALIGLGIDAKRLTAKGYGDSKPLAVNDTEDGKAKNRRVQLTKL